MFLIHQQNHCHQQKITLMNEDIYIMSELHSLMKKLISSMNDINSTTNKNNSWWVKRVAIRNHKFTMNFLILFSWSWWNILYMKECKSRCLNIICSLCQKMYQKKKLLDETLWLLIWKNDLVWRTEKSICTNKKPRHDEWLMVARGLLYKTFASELQQWMIQQYHSPPLSSDWLIHQSM